MKERLKNLFSNNPLLRQIIGVIFVLLGFFALVTPFTPGSWLIFVGFELLGLRFLFLERLKKLLKK